MLEFSLFGGVRVFGSDKNEIHLGRKQRQVLALLMLSPHSIVEPDVIIDHIWAEKLPSNPGNSLQDLIRRLRVALGDFDRRLIVTRNGAYGLFADPDSMDVEIFRRLASAGISLETAEPSAARLLLARALENAEGDLPDISPDFRASEQIEALYNLRSAATQALTRLERKGDFGEGRAGFTLWSLQGQPVGLALNLTELGELMLADLVNTVTRCGGRVHRLSQGLMMASFFGGGGALRAASDLIHKFGLSPGVLGGGAICHVESGGPVDEAEALIKLAAKARSGQILVSEDIYLSSAKAHHRDDLSYFEDGIRQIGGGEPDVREVSFQPAEVELVGRNEALLEVADLIDKHRLVTLRGPGGIGKTRMARAVLDSFAKRFADGPVLVDFAEAERQSDLILLVIRCLGLVPKPYQRPEHLLVEHLRDAQRLLVFDNCEELLEPIRRICRIVTSQCPDVRLLATSRTALGMPGEVVYDVAELSLVDAAELLIALSPIPSSEVEPGHIDPRVVELCMLLDCVPLAIECAASMIRAMGLEGAADSLSALPDGAFLPLLDAAHGGRGRHRSIELALNVSYRFLAEPDARFFERLCCLVGSFSIDDARVASPDPDGYLVEPGLNRLAEASLLKVVGPNRWRMLEPVRQFAATNLLRRGEQAEQATRHAVHFTKLARDIEGNLRSSEEALWFDRVTYAYPNMVKALSRLVEICDAENALQLTSSLWWYWAARGMFVEASQAVESALAIPAPAPPLLRARALTTASHLAWWAGSPYRTESSLLEAKDLIEAAGRSSAETAGLEAWVYTGLAGARMWGGGDYDLLKGYLERGAELFRSTGDLSGLGINLQTHSGLAWHEGDDRTALAKAMEALEVFDSVNHMTMVASARRAIGLARAVLGDVAGGRPEIHEGLRLSEKLGDLGGLPLGHCYLGLLEIAAGDRAAAAEAFSHSVAANDNLGQVWPTLIVLGVGSEQAALNARPADSLRLDAAASNLTDRTGIQLSSRDRRRVSAALARAAGSLSTPDATAAHREGEALPLARAVKLALEVFEETRALEA
jgi:predicted ATPase/DNA-binding winged helix-turn-helix (wHTH) protein